MARPKGTDKRGNPEDRRKRRLWLMKTYRSNTYTETCRCYRCGDLLSLVTLTVDRIIPGIHGGTYRRNNIRPACGSCNSETGATLRRS